MTANKVDSGSSFAVSRRDALMMTTAGLTLAALGTPAHAQSGVTPAEARALAKEAYIWGYPIVDTYRINYDYFVNTGHPEFKATWNNLTHNTRLYTPDDKTIQTINSDTLYSFIGANLRDEPIVITVPAVPKERYYGCSLFDIWGTCYDTFGTRATGNDPGSFMIAGPGWKGETPKGINKVYITETIIGMPTFRTQLFNPDDIENVKKVQAGYKVQTLSAFLGQAAPKATPVNFPKALTVQQQKTPEFFGMLNSLLQFAPTHPSEVELKARFAKIGVGEGKIFDSSKLSPEIKAALEQGVADAWVDITAAMAKLSSGEVPVSNVVGPRSYVRNNYLYRAAVIVTGGPAQEKQEVVYINVGADAEGRPFDGANKYVMRFAPDKMPPCKSFWSITMYDLPGRLLVANPINRYLLNTPMLPNWVKDADGGYTFYMQNESPGKDKEANWLPAPNGPFYMFMRLYLPEPEAYDGRWNAPKPAKV